VTKREHHDAEHLDRQWDRYQDGIVGDDEDIDPITRLHHWDKSLAPSAEFRERLHTELRAMHPGTAAHLEQPPAAEHGTITDTSDREPRRPITFHRPSTLRQWGELAAMLLILVIAIAGAALYGDQAYWSDLHRECAREAGVDYRINRRAKPGRELTEAHKRTNRRRSKARARGEHAFRVVKQLWGFAKVRYRGIAKNLARAHVAFALANLHMLRRRMLPPQVRCA
jgi:IS5 family transposase